MQINNIDGLILPKKSNEEFLKINFDSLFSYDFANKESYEFDIMGLETIVDEEKYESVLFDISRTLDNKQKIITINKNIAEPIFLIHKLKENETIFSNSLKIKVAKDIKASIVEVFVNSCQNSFYAVNRKIELEENASLEYVKVQDINSSNSMIFSLAVNQKNSSNLEISNFEYGDGFVVNSYENIINSELANYELNGLIKLNKEATTSNLIKTIHNEKSSISNINYKHSLKDSSKAVFKAKSIVNETALFSKAFQNCNTILLSDDATIFAQPHLEILIDELEASHGTTTGTLNKEQLLYLQSRGISKNEAYEMLLSAFENKIVDNIKDEIIKEFIKTYKRENMFKNDFPYFQKSKTIYLDNGATTQKPKAVIDSQVEYYEAYCANTHRSNFGHANKATQEFEKTRVLLKEFINASKNEEIIFTKGVTESINFIASSFATHFKTVIISSLEHHSNIVPWHMQGRTLGAGLEVVNCDKNLNFDLFHFEELLKANPNAFVSITHISNAFGKIHDIKNIIKLAHEYGAIVMVDGAQSLAHFKINVQELDVDFFAISGHKTFAPTGVGAIYVKEKYLKDVKPYQTGGATIHEVDFTGSTLLNSPYKFEAGTQNIAGIIGFGKAIEYINYVKYENIESIEKNVFKFLDEELSKLPGIIFYNDMDNCIGSRSFNFEGLIHDDIGILLDKMGVAVRVGHHCAQPIMKKLGIKGTIRVSTAFYNDYVDVDKLIESLKKSTKYVKGLKLNTIEQRVNEIKEDLDFFEDELSKYEYIIDLGKKLEDFNEADKIPANIVHGCTSQVWLTHEIKDGKMFFHGTSDAIIVKGLVYMILKIFSNSTIQELKDIDMDIVHELKLSEVITPNRQSGVIGMMKKIKEYALSA